MTIIDFMSDFVKVNDELKQAVNAAWSNTFKVQKGELLSKYGALNSYMYFIVSGCLEAYYLHNGKHISKWFCFEEELVSSAFSHLTNQSDNYVIVAAEECVLLKINYTDIDALSLKFPEMERFIRINTQHCLLWHEERILSLNSKTAKERYTEMLVKEPQIIKRIPLSRIATYLGIAQETLSRIRSSTSYTK
jgi:CRP-like cAMP-binding protein